VPALVVVAESTASAQQPDPVTEVARQRYEEGVKAFDAGRYEDARSAFLQAYALKRHPAVLLNLGLSELRGKYPEDGANHLQQFLREHSAATPDQKSSAEKAIADAKKKTAFVVVIVDANGADVSIDGASIGKSPLLDPFFVKPGKHTALATLQGKSATAQVDAKVGSATAANLSLGTSGTAPPVAPVTGPPGPANPPPPTTPIGAPPGTSQPPPAYPPMGGSQISAGGQGAIGMEPDRGTPTTREPFFEWYTHKPLAWVGTGVAAVGLVTGIIFSIAAGSASGAASEHTDQITAEANKDGISKPCGPIDSDGSRDLPKYRKACDHLREDISDHDTDFALAVTGWVFFGVGVVGTATYALVDWYPGKKKSTGSLVVSPVVTPSHQGLVVVGSF